MNSDKELYIYYNNLPYDYATAINLYLKQLINKPDVVNILNKLGVAYYQNGYYENAINIIKHGLTFDELNCSLLNNLGISLQALGRHEEAINEFYKGINIDINNPLLHFNLANSFFNLKNYNEALNYYNLSLAIKYNSPDCWNNKGTAYHELGKYEDAVNCFNIAISQQTNFATCYFNLGNSYRMIFDYNNAISSFEQAIKIDPNYAEAYYICGNLFVELKMIEKACSYLDIAFKLNPDRKFLHSDLFYLRMNICDWENFESDYNFFISNIRSSNLVTPFTTIAFLNDPTLQLMASKRYSEEIDIKNCSTNVLHSKNVKKRKIIGYYSSDFYSHATSFLFADVIKNHNKEIFEVILFSFSPIEDNVTDLLKAYSDRYIQLHQINDSEAAALSRDIGIDIAVDLKGYTTFARPGIFQNRAAPIQIQYLGYPGTLGSPAYDYIIGDEITIPTNFDKFYSEKVLRLSSSYQPCSSYFFNSLKGLNKSELGLSEYSFIFCCFNNSFKITPTVFCCWMRILYAVKDSVLWLYANNNSVVRNLRLQASSHGIDPNRLIFCNHVEHSLHLSRIALSDIFLDTFPCNAHTTARDALEVGLPIVTIEGATFASRVCASLKQLFPSAVHVTANYEQYVECAIKLANELRIDKSYYSDFGVNNFDINNFVHDYEHLLLGLFKDRL